MPLASTTAMVVGALLVVAYLACGVVTVLKRKWGSLIVGFFFVVFRTPSEAESICPGPGGVFVQRLIGLPGDLLEISDRVYVNSEPLDEPYLNGGRVGDRFGPVTVPDDRYFVMGDNRYQSCDSRE